ncbi:VOC family protein [Mesorhizobium sp.]|uniref:VOC family protein n=1 Tax=Mesorhizobium sp. TaxID=1871066 RepID=UPI0025DD5A18|nr:VOC family protein [Mesorhizobium sp.]
MKVTALDHIVLAVADVERTCRFYERVLGMEPRQERPGKWSLHFGTNKISLQDAHASPDIARDTVPGSGNFCLLTDTPIDEVGSSRRKVLRLSPGRASVPEPSAPSFRSISRTLTRIWSRSATGFGVLEWRP